MFVLKRVLFVGARLTWRTTPSSRLRFNGRLRLYRQCVLPLSLERRFWRAPCQLLGSGLVFFCLNSGDNLLCLLTLLDQLFLDTIFSYSYWARSEVCKLWWHVSTKVAWVILLGHQSVIFWDLSTNVLTGFPLCCLIARRVGMVISESSSKKRVRKSFSRSPQFLIEPSESFMNHSKTISFRVPMNKRICAILVTPCRRNPVGVEL